MPIIAYSYNFCICHIGKCRYQIKALTRNILVLINYDVLKIKFLLHFLYFTKQTSRFVNHILEIYGIIFFQIALILEKTILANIQKEACSNILCGMIHTVKFIRSISVSLKVSDESANKINKFAYITIFFRWDKLFHNFFIWTRS